jgi:DnaJ-like protein
MVELPGSLERSTLGDVLGALHRDGVTGALRLEETGSGHGHQHVIYWHDGLIHQIETSRFAPRPGWTAHDPRHRQARLWTRDDPEKRQRLEQLEALFGLTRAKISFRVMGRRPARAAEPLEPAEFLHGRQRQRQREAEAEAEAPPTAPASPASDTPHERALRTLGLSGQPDHDAVRAAFRQLARRWHPDRHPSVGELTRAALCRRFVAIATAYEHLMARSA